MSHNKRTNYSKMSTTPAVVDSMPEVVNLMGVQMTSAVVDVESETTVATSEVEINPEPPIEPVEGFVSGCKKLNVREKASLEGKILCEVSEGDTLMIDKSESTEDWFRVYTETGVEGYCMKKFVIIET